MQALVLALALSAVTADNYATNDKKPVGVGVYAYQDSTGKRYGGTYDLNEADIPNFAQYAPDFSGFPRGFPGSFPFGPADGGGADFFAQFMKSLQKSLQQAFPGNEANQQAALHSVDSAFDATYGGGGYGAGGGVPNYQDLGQRYAMQGLGNYQHPQGANSAYAGGAVGPDGIHQVASISPANQNQPNVDVSSRSSDGGGFRSVSTSSFASSSDVGGKRTENRGAKTVVNDNGKVTEYNVRS